ncbi:hypothetical protein HN777_05005 [Candidatus Woesearchaeota archaeon]|jgi:hypothetical protein|nr:hypothetical protein [Candidatus Woesearchaeota archaeon]MBT7403116.1 hypothetical protein [Candidatus Woesearchaeota archaeon]
MKENNENELKYSKSEKYLAKTHLFTVHKWDISKGSYGATLEVKISKDIESITEAFPDYTQIKNFCGIVDVSYGCITPRGGYAYGIYYDVEFKGNSLQGITEKNIKEGSLKKTLYASNVLGVDLVQELSDEAIISKIKYCCDNKD